MPCTSSEVGITGDRRSNGICFPIVRWPTVRAVSREGLLERECIDQSSGLEFISKE